MSNFFSYTAFLSSAVLLLSVSHTTAQTQTRLISADIWADNWFALYVNEKLVIEDSVPITTERSFNTESFIFDAELPAQVSIIMKDFKENDTGLEYIGSRRQQMGDGGLIAQFYEVNNDRLIAVSNTAWRCLVIHQAPLNKSCEKSRNPEAECGTLTQPEPAGWMSSVFDDSSWSNAIEYTTDDVRPHGDYDRYSWATTAKLIWSDDLEMDNTVLCRFTLTATD